MCGPWTTSISIPGTHQIGKFLGPSQPCGARTSEDADQQDVCAKQLSRWFRFGLTLTPAMREPKRKEGLTETRYFVSDINSTSWHDNVLSGQRDGGRKDFLKPFRSALTDQG